MKHFTPPHFQNLVLIVLALFFIKSLHAQYDCQFVDPCVNLSCFNGFEAYPVGPSPGIHDDLGGAWIFSGYFDNEPRICMGADNNRYLLLDTDVGLNRPGVCFPLIEPIEPGCSIHIEFLGARNDDGHETTGTVLFLGSEHYPCLQTQTAVAVGCTSTNCGGQTYNPVCIGQQALTLLQQATPSCGINQNQMTLYNLPVFTNNNNFPINFITIYNEENSYTNWVAIDNIVITRDCGIDADFTWEVHQCHVDFTSVNQSDGIDHLWNFNNGIGSTSRSTNPSYTFPGTGTYTVSHTIFTDCGDFTVTHEIFVECNPDRMCGCEDMKYNIGSEAFPNADVYYSGTVLANTVSFEPCLSFVGRKLIIDVPLVEWKAVHAYMSPGSEIVIETGNEFNYTLGTIEGCEAMWRGITVQQEATFESGALKVKDAYRGLWARFGSAIYTKQMTFENCYIGMSIDNSVTQLGSGVIYCDFTTPGPFMPPYTGQPSGQVDRTFAGISLNNADMFTVGVQGFAGVGNSFESVKTGILSAGSLFSSDYNTFSDDPSADMYGMRSNYNSDAQVRDNSFLYTHTGINSSNSNVEALRNDFIVGTIGITAQGSQTTKIKINESNHFESLTFGNWLSGISAADDLEIIDNVFDDCNRGIFVSSSSTTSNDPPGKIEYNILNDNYIGIEVAGSSNWLVYDNIVNFDVGGIQLNNSHANQVRNNQAYGSSIQQGTAMNISNSMSNFLCCNHLGNSKQGLLITGVSTMVNGINRTHFNAHEDALIYKKIAMVMPESGTQTLTGNKWNVLSTGHPAFFDGTLIEANQSKYIVETLPAGIINPPTWFLANGLENTDCPENNEEPETCGTTIWSRNEMTEYDENVVENMLVTDGYREAVVWIEKMRVFNKLISNPTFIDGIYEQFYNEQLNSEIGKICIFNRRLKAAQSITTVDTNNLNNIYLLFDEIQNLNVQLLTVQDEEVSRSVYQLEKNALFAQAQTLLTQYHAEVEESHNLQVAQFNILQSALLQIDANMIYGETFKAVHHIYLQYLISQDINLSDLEDLIIIANSCPFELGFAVYSARYIVDEFQGAPSSWPELEECCTNPNPPLRKSSEVKGNLAIEIFPNPASQYLHIKLNESLDFKYNLIHADQSPVRLMVDGSAIINIDDLAPGIYLLEMFVAEEKIVRKFIKL